MYVVDDSHTVPGRSEAPCLYLTLHIWPQLGWPWQHLGIHVAGGRPPSKGSPAKCFRSNPNGSWLINVVAGEVLVRSCMCWALVVAHSCFLFVRAAGPLPPAHAGKPSGRQACRHQCMQPCSRCRVRKCSLQRARYASVLRAVARPAQPKAQLLLLIDERMPH